MCRKTRQLELQGPTWHAPSGGWLVACTPAFVGSVHGALCLCLPVKARPPSLSPTRARMHPHMHTHAVREVLRSLPFLHSAPQRLFDYLLEHGQLLGGWVR